MRSVLIVTLIVLASVPSRLRAEERRGVSEQQMARVLRQAFPSAPTDWRSRLVPDATIAVCAKWDNQPPKDMADAIKKSEVTKIRHPPDGNFMGDWRRGEAVAQSGYGLRFTDNDTTRPNGGNCYACHELSPDEVSFGTLGVSLKGYGRTHKFDPQHARVVYEKIYNSQAVVTCSTMPRFGANGILSIDQIKDLVALLMDPNSPVNKPASTAPNGETGNKTKAGGAASGRR
jgi:L-cysteine S-thiosulfotransferase